MVVPVHIVLKNGSILGELTEGEKRTANSEGEDVVLLVHPLTY